MYANIAASEMFGYDRRDIGRIKLLDLVAPSDREQVDGAVASMLDGRSDGDEREYLFKRKDGSAFPGRAYTTLISDERGARIGIS